MFIRARVSFSFFSILKFLAARTLLILGLTEMVEAMALFLPLYMWGIDEVNRLPEPLPLSASVIYYCD